MLAVKFLMNGNQISKYLFNFNKMKNRKKFMGVFLLFSFVILNKYLVSMNPVDKNLV